MATITDFVKGTDADELHVEHNNLKYVVVVRANNQVDLPPSVTDAALKVELTTAATDFMGKYNAANPDLREIIDNAFNNRHSAEQARKDGRFAAYAGAAILGVVGALGGVIYGSSQHAGDFDKGKQAGFAAGKDAGYALGFNTSEDQIHDDLEAMILGGNATALGGGLWNRDLVNQTASELYNTTNLSKLNATQLAGLYAHLAVETGVLATPEAINATEIILREIELKWGVPLENLTQNNPNLFDAVAAYADLVKLDAERVLLQKAGTWNETQYRLGKEAILNNISGYTNASYQLGKKHGAQDVYNQTNGANGWNATWKGDGKAASLAEVVGFVDGLLSQDQISGKNITALVELYGQTVKNNALALADYTADYVLQQTEAGDLNESERALNRVGAMYGDVRVSGEDHYQTLMSNLTANETRELKQAGLNLSRLYNNGFSFRFTDTFGDRAVASAYGNSTVVRVPMSQSLMDKLKGINFGGQ